MARVRGVMAASILVTSMLRVRGSISTNTGVAPASQIASAVAKNVLDTVMTSSPGPIPRPTKTSRSASVPELTPTASLVHGAGQFFLKLFHLRPEDVRPALEDLVDGLIDFGAQVVVLAHVPVKANFQLCHFCPPPVFRAAARLLYPVGRPRER